MAATAQVDGARSGLLVDGSGKAVRPYHGEPIVWVPLDFEKITVANASLGFTAGKLTNLYAAAVANAGPDFCQAVCRLETAEIRYLYDPNVEINVMSTTVGTLLEINDTLVISGKQALAFFRAIRTGGTSGVLSVTYEYGTVLS